MEIRRKRCRQGLVRAGVAELLDAQVRVRALRGRGGVQRALHAVLRRLGLAEQLEGDQRRAPVARHLVLVAGVQRRTHVLHVAGAPQAGDDVANPCHERRVGRGHAAARLDEDLLVDAVGEAGTVDGAVGTLGVAVADLARVEGVLPDRSRQHEGGDDERDPPEDGEAGVRRAPGGGAGGDIGPVHDGNLGADRSRRLPVCAPRSNVRSRGTAAIRRLHGHACAEPLTSKLGARLACGRRLSRSPGGTNAHRASSRGRRPATAPIGGGFHVRRHRRLDYRLDPHRKSLCCRVPGVTAATGRPRGGAVGPWAPTGTDGVQCGEQTERNDANSGQPEAVLRSRTRPGSTRSFRLGAGRSQVQILSPRSSESPGNPGLLPVLGTTISGHGVQDGVQFCTRRL